MILAKLVSKEFLSKRECPEESSAKLRRYKTRQMILNLLLSSHQVHETSREHPHTSKRLFLRFRSFTIRLGSNRPPHRHASQNLYLSRSPLADPKFTMLRNDPNISLAALVQGSLRSRKISPGHLKMKTRLSMTMTKNHWNIFLSGPLLARISSPASIIVGKSPKLKYTMEESAMSKSVESSSKKDSLVTKTRRRETNNNL